MTREERIAAIDRLIDGAASDDDYEHPEAIEGKRDRFGETLRALAELYKRCGVYSLEAMTDEQLEEAERIVRSKLATFN